MNGTEWGVIIWCALFWWLVVKYFWGAVLLFFGTTLIAWVVIRVPPHK